MRRSLHSIFIIALIFLIGSFGEAFSQESKKVRERIQLVKKMKLLDELDLDEETAEKVIKVYEEWEDKLEKQEELMDAAAVDLKRSIERGDSQKEITKKTERFVSLQNQYYDIIEQKFKAMKKILGEIDYAKFVLFEHYFKIELTKILFKHKGRGGAGRRGR